MSSPYETIDGLREAVQRTSLNLLALRETIEPMAKQVIHPKDNVFTRQLKLIDESREMLRIAINLPSCIDHPTPQPSMASHAENSVSVSVRYGNLKG